MELTKCKLGELITQRREKMMAQICQSAEYQKMG